MLSCNPHIRNLIGEVLFIPRLMLHLPPILAGVYIPSSRSFSPTLSDEISDIGVTMLYNLIYSFNLI